MRACPNNITVLLPHRGEERGERRNRLEKNKGKNLERRRGEEKNVKQRE